MNWYFLRAPWAAVQHRATSRYLCLAIVSKNRDAWVVLSELRILLTQHVEHLRRVAAAKLSGAAEFIERRSNLNDLLPHARIPSRRNARKRANPLKPTLAERAAKIRNSND